MAHIDINTLLNIVLGLIMFGLGLSLSADDFKNLFNQPRSLAIGLIAQMVLLPLIAWFVCTVAPLNNELKVGIMILSVCPGGITSNLVSYFVKGNVALGISLTVCNAFLSLFTIPVLVNMFLQYFMKSGQIIELPFWKTMYDIFLITILPAALGVAINSKWRSAANNAEKYLNFVLPFLLLMVFVFKFLGSSENGGTGIVRSEIMQLAPWVIVLNVVSMFVGFFAGIFFKLNFKNRITIAVEVGLHNTALALLVAGAKLKNANMEKPALVYALFSFFITFSIAWVIMKIYKRLSKQTVA